MLVDRIIEAAEAKAKARVQTNKIGAHNVGRCVRQLWYQVHGVEAEPMQGRAMLVFDLGDRIEQALIHLLTEAGVEGLRAADPEKDKVEVAEIGGRVIADLFFTANGREWPAECKSMSNFAFERAERGELDDSYLAQAEVYMRAYDVPWIPLIAYRKETSHLTEVIIKRDDSRWEMIKRNAAAAQGDTVPERPYKLAVLCEGCHGSGRTPTGKQAHSACNGTGRMQGGPYLPSFPCGYCSWKDACWGATEQVFDKNNRPKWRLAGVTEAA